MYGTKFNLRISYSAHVWLAQLRRHQTSKPVIVSVVSSIPTGGNFIFYENFLKPLMLCFLKFFGRHKYFWWGHWYPCFGFLVMSNLSLKAKVSPTLAWFVTCIQWIPQVHLWCNTCWPLGSQHHSTGLLIIQSLQLDYKPTLRCQFCTKMPEMSDLCYLEKIRIVDQLYLGNSSKIPDEGKENETYSSDMTKYHGNSQTGDRDYK